MLKTIKAATGRSADAHVCESLYEFSKGPQATSPSLHADVEVRAPFSLVNLIDNLIPNELDISAQRQPRADLRMLSR